MTRPDGSTAQGADGCGQGSLGQGSFGQGSFGLSRRGLLKAAGTASLALAVGPGLDLAGPASAAAVGGGTIVVVSLRGGADGLTMVPPLGDPHYAAARPSTAVPASRATRLDTVFGLHPQLAPLLPHWTARRLAVVHATGGPLPSRSHFDAVLAMQQAVFGAGARTGWLDRLLGVLGASQVFGGVTIGNATPSILAGPRPTLTMSSASSLRLDVWDAVEASYLTALRGLHHYSDPVSLMAGSNLSAISGVAAAGARTTSPANGAVYPPGELGGKLRDLARLLRGGLPVRAAHVEVGGYDVHTRLGAAGGVDSGVMHDLLGELGRAVAAFAADIGPSLLARTTVVTTSEFGRRVGENGSAGVDHGRGGPMLVLGGGVVGGKVYGTWPGLAPEALDRGDVRVTTDYRNVFAEVLTDRFGLGSAGLSAVFPGLTHRPLGLTRST